MQDLHYFKRYTFCMQSKLLIGVLGIAVLGMLAFIVWKLPGYLQENAEMVTPGITNTNTPAAVSGKTYTDPLSRMRFTYPEGSTVTHEAGWRDEYFDLVIAGPGTRAEIHAEHTGGSLPQCFLGLCDANGTREKYGSNEWVHLGKPLVCAADRCPQNQEVYRASVLSWTYYAIFPTEQEARTILSTLQFL